MYGTLDDLVTYGAPATVLASFTPAQQIGALSNASTLMDSKFRGRYALPFVRYGLEVTQRCCEIAAWLLISFRGLQPNAGADVQAIRLRYEDAMKWLDQVQRQAAHPDVTPQASQTPGYVRPIVLSQSVVNTGGGVGTNRGW